MARYSSAEWARALRTSLLADIVAVESGSVANGVVSAEKLHDLVQRMEAMLADLEDDGDGHHHKYAPSIF